MAMEAAVTCHPQSLLLSHLHMLLQPPGSQNGKRGTFVTKRWQQKVFIQDFVQHWQVTVAALYLKPTLLQEAAKQLFPHWTKLSSPENICISLSPSQDVPISLLPFMIY